MFFYFLLLPSFLHCRRLTCLPTILQLVHLHQGFVSCLYTNQLFSFFMGFVFNETVLALKFSLHNGLIARICISSVDRVL